MASRILAAGAALGILFASVPADAAAPRPRADQWWFAKLGIPRIHSESTGQGVKVAVIDTGFDTSVPEFKGLAIARPKSFPTAHSPEEPDHGTAVTALIAAQGKGNGYLGLAPGVEVLPIALGKIDETKSHLAEGRIHEAIRYAVEQGAKVINISMGREDALATPTAACTWRLQAAVDYAIDQDVVIIAGAGNDDNFTRGNWSVEPAQCPGVVAVAALDPDNTTVQFRVHHDYISLAAPGAGMTTLRAKSRLEVRRGTSYAAPLVSGVTALLRAKYPTEDARTIVARLLNSAQDVHTKGKDTYTGHGLVRADLALTKPLPQNAPNPVFERRDSWIALRDKKAANKKAVDDSLKRAASRGPADVPASDWETYGPTLAAGAVAFLAVVGTTGVLLARRRRRGPGAA